MQPLAILDIYVLSMLDRGLQSQYELQKLGGLSLGASTPALKRLVSAGSVKQHKSEKTGKRIRFEFHLTASGRSQARTAWRRWFTPESLPSDLDALLRLVDLAVHYKQPQSEVLELLARATEQRQNHADIARGTSARLQQRRELSYPQLRAACDRLRLHAEAKALAAIGKHLGAEYKSEKTKRTAAGKTSKPRRGSRSKPR
jgi:DNA-binding PadR family transcriptional regulator